MKIKIHLENPGTLPDIIRQSRRHSIAELTLTGNLNGADIELIRQMSGGYDTGAYAWDAARNKPGPLSKLDLSEANIVSGEPIYKHTEYYDRIKGSLDDFFAAYDGYVEIRGSRGGYKFGSRNKTVNNVISDEMFLNCWRLVEIILPNSITKIEDIAFLGCSHLTSIHIGPNVKSLGSYVFRDCSRLKDIHIRSLRSPIIKDNTFSKNLISKNDLKVYIPKGSLSSYWLAWEFDNIVEV